MALDRFIGEIQVLIRSTDTKFYIYNCTLKARRSIYFLSKLITYLTALLQLNNII
jgi:hypothetical protein